MTISRRKFIRSAAQTGFAAATLSEFPPSIRKALAIPAFHETGTTKDVKHVVILTQENRAFDHYFGTLKGVRGFGDRFTVPQPGGIDRAGKVTLVMPVIEMGQG
jgi:phospholipase C